MFSNSKASMEGWGGLIGSAIKGFQFGSPLLRQQRLPKIAELLDPPWHIVDAKVFDSYALFDLFPGERCGDRGFGLRPHGINRGERLAPGVLIIVQQHALARSLGDSIFDCN